VIVVITNEAGFIPDCLGSLLGQDQPDYEVIVVDNASTDGGPELIEREYARVRLIRNASNLGYVGANNVGFAAASGSVLAVVNPDTRMEPGWLRGLVDAVSDPAIGLATSQALLYDEPGLVNACGNDVHVSGLGFCHGLGRPRDSVRAGPVAAVSGCGFAIRRDVLDAIGGFDEMFWAYVEDTDLSFRARLAGYQIAYAPASVLFHRYALRMRPAKFFHIERNRRLLLWKNLRVSTLVLLAPALLLGELMMWAFALLRGPAYLREKARADAWLIRERKRWRRARAGAQALRKVGDRDLLPWLTARLDPAQVVGEGGVGRAIGAVATFAFAIAAAPARLLAR
jgi:GT2 family glycosyltransferase